jgi:tryptophan-rich sensory protein
LVEARYGHQLALHWLAILACLLAFWKVSRPAGLLMVPYLVWVSYASALNFAIWSLNG